MIPFESIPLIHKALSDSLRHFGIESLIPNISFDVIKDVTIESPVDISMLDMAFLSVRMWDFCLVSAAGKPECLLTLDPGDYTINVSQIEKIAGNDDGFPLRFRQVRICLHESAEKWAMIMNGGCAN